MPNFKVISEEVNGNSAVVVIEPLAQGYGHTVGNSLRRVMLSSLKGSAITSAKIDGVSHKFSTVPGVLEDVIDVVLNLKGVRIKLFSEDKVVRAKIAKSGEGEVTGADIDMGGAGEVVNPEVHIATLTDKKAKLNIELTMESGVGYMAIDEKKTSEIGVISVDAIYTPVLAVNYKVEQTRVGRKTDFDKLSIEVITDGTISGYDAVIESAKILESYFKQVYDPTEVIEEEITPAASLIANDLMKASVEELDLPVRITNALKAIEVDTVEKLVGVPKVQLIKAKNLGAKSLSLISEKLAERGLTLSEA